MNTDVIDEVLVEDEVELTGKDRCDLCGSQAYAQVLFGESDLYFCGHHFTQAETKLRATATKINDQRWRLSDKPLDVSA
jgi:hypothetical protein